MLPLASILVSSYNYGRFLEQAIDSAIGQTYPNVEVVVVDDCSTDNSPVIITRYGSKIRSVLREKNVGGKAAYNDSLQLTHGDFIFFLDSDDAFAPTAVEKAIFLFDSPDVVKVHWPLIGIGTNGQPTGLMIPDGSLPDGNLRERVINDGYCSCASPPTSGNAWSRKFLERMLPVPKGAYCDAYLAAMASVFGIVRAVSEPLGFYRRHSGNQYSRRPFEEWLTREQLHDELCCKGMSAYLQSIGIPVTTDSLKQKSWYNQRLVAAQDLLQILPEKCTFILVDEDNWATGGTFSGCRVLPYTEQNGYYGGPPKDDAAAIEELERLRKQGATFIAFAWPAFWWLEYYAEFNNYLRGKYVCLLQSDKLTIFDLRDPNSK